MASCPTANKSAPLGTVKDIAQANKKERKPEKKGNVKEGAGKQKWSKLHPGRSECFYIHHRSFCWKEGENVALVFQEVKRGRANKKNKEDFYG